MNCDPSDRTPPTAVKVDYKMLKSFMHRPVLKEVTRLLWILRIFTVSGKNVLRLNFQIFGLHEHQQGFDAGNLPPEHFFMKILPEC